MSEWLVLAIVMAAACAVVLVVTVLSQRAARPAAAAADLDDREAPQTPDVLEYMVMMVGVVYAIVLGLAIAGVWEARGAAQDAVRTEAQALYEVTQRAQVYPADFRDRLRTDIDTYVSEVVETEWPRMVEQQELSSRGTELLAAVRSEVAEREPKNELEAQAYQPMLDQVAAAEDARNARAAGAEETLPGIVWFGLISGAVVTIGLIFTMQIGRTFRELLLAGLFSALIAFLLFLVWDFDAPFGRSGSESADAFRQLFPGAAGPG
jgi:ABC-type multidrug transport system fused ATPase/permease subunit